MDSSLGNESIRTSISLAVLAISCANKLVKSSGEGEGAAAAWPSGGMVPGVLAGGENVKNRIFELE